MLLLSADLEVLALHSTVTFHPDFRCTDAISLLTAYMRRQHSNQSVESAYPLDGVHVDGFAHIARQPQHNLLRGLGLQAPDDRSLSTWVPSGGPQPKVKERQRTGSRTQLLRAPRTFLWKTGLVWPP